MIKITIHCCNSNVESLLVVFRGCHTYSRRIGLKMGLIPFYNSSTVILKDVCVHSVCVCVCWKQRINGKRQYTSLMEIELIHGIVRYLKTLKAQVFTLNLALWHCELRHRHLSSQCQFEIWLPLLLLELPTTNASGPLTYIWHSWMEFQCSGIIYGQPQLLWPFEDLSWSVYLDLSLPVVQLSKSFLKKINTCINTSCQQVV